MCEVQVLGRGIGTFHSGFFSDAYHIVLLRCSVEKNNCIVLFVMSLMSKLPVTR